MARDQHMPNSRLVRVLMSPDQDDFQKETTALLMQFGQFVDHDITHVPVFQLGNVLATLPLTNDFMTSTSQPTPREFPAAHKTASTYPNRCAILTALLWTFCRMIRFTVSTAWSASTSCVPWLPLVLIASSVMLSNLIRYLGV